LLRVVCADANTPTYRWSSCAPGLHLLAGFDKPNNVSNVPVTMNGFVQVAPPGTGSQPFVMSAFNSTNLPVLSTLATEYAVFDHWHCSCPCPTNPNREFLMSGTSNGMVVNTIPDAGFPQVRTRRRQRQRLLQRSPSVLPALGASCRWRPS